MPAYQWLVALAVADFSSLTLTKLYTQNMNISFLIMATVLYGSVPFLMSNLLKSGMFLGDANFSWNVFSTLAVYSIGVLMFGEQITPSRATGVMLGILAIWFITNSYKTKKQEK